MEPWTQEVNKPLLWECAPGKSCSVLAPLLKMVASLLGPIPAGFVVGTWGIPKSEASRPLVMLVMNPLISLIPLFCFSGIPDEIPGCFHLP